MEKLIKGIFFNKLRVVRKFSKKKMSPPPSIRYIRVLLNLIVIYEMTFLIHNLMLTECIPVFVYCNM